ncbi:MAG: YcxB family protein [Clostridia bacterium]
MEYNGIFKIAAKENERYNMYVAYKKLIVSCLIVFIIIMLLLGLTYYAADGSLNSALLKSLPMALGGAVLLFLINVVIIKLKVRSFYKKNKISVFTQDITLHNGGIHAKSENGEVELTYKHIKNVVETRWDFFIFLTDLHAYVLPKNQMKDQADIALIRSIFRAHMDEKALSFKS